jgi:hypothetical protein
MACGVSGRCPAVAATQRYAELRAGACGATGNVEARDLKVKSAEECWHAHAALGGAKPPAKGDGVTRAPPVDSAALPGGCFVDAAGAPTFNNNTASAAAVRNLKFTGLTQNLGQL